MFKRKNIMYITVLVKEVIIGITIFQLVCLVNFVLYMNDYRSTENNF
jgi:hypothetical protein